MDAAHRQQISPWIRQQRQARGQCCVAQSTMFLIYIPDGSLVEIKQREALVDPFIDTVEGRFHAGEELQDPQSFLKRELRFPSGEALPRCWLDPGYGRSAEHGP